MTATLLAILVTVALTSALSGVLGMGGGLILMGVLALTLPVAGAMVLHGIAQLTANGARAVLHRRHIAWRVLPGYVLGAAAGLALFVALNVVTETWIVQIGLGLFPFLALRAKSVAMVSIETSWHRVLCGLAVTALQLLAGASGPVLDVFFLRTKLNRHEIVATKALTQSLGHSLKLLYYGGLSRTLPEMAALSPVHWPAWALPVVVVALAVLGTTVGGRLLDRLSDGTFQKFSRRLILGIGGLYLVQGIVGCARAAFLP